MVSRVMELLYIRNRLTTGCTRCCLEAQSIEIISLKESLAALSSQLNSLQETLSSRSQPIEALSTEIIQIKNRLEEAPSFPPSIHISHSSPTSGVAPQTNVPGTVGKKAIPSVTDRKYNIVVFGITEPSQGTPRVTRINSDIERVTEELTQLATTSGFSFQVRDCHRLGQYRPNSTKSRPLLVTLSSTIQVSNILSNCHHLSGVVSVRPDLSASERRERGILMKERWKLVNADIDRRSIKVKGSGLYVSGNLTGKVLNGVFQVTQGLGAKAPQLYSILNNQNQSISVNSNSTSDQSDIIQQNSQDRDASVSRSLLPQSGTGGTLLQNSQDQGASVARSLLLQSDTDKHQSSQDRGASAPQSLLSHSDSSVDSSHQSSQDQGASLSQSLLSHSDAVRGPFSSTGITSQMGLAAYSGRSDQTGGSTTSTSGLSS
uniref:Uncharacterized protein n=1 Tax=Amphimedon queenslandica TaxID=400682 RepID=A0A1X7SYA1_AMPQE